ncbi:hypothetical protein J4Q44_G00058790 [Coregonus suidteri]|uniref:EF-hand domain-containing protein n=1 Tax=Coregonus suidteri TaxID=861788 RepID=A0AAN8R0F6_9TELE
MTFYRLMMMHADKSSLHPSLWRGRNTPPPHFSFYPLREHHSDYHGRNLPIMAARFQVKDHHQSQTPWHSPHPWKPPWEPSSWHFTSTLAVERELTNLIKAELPNIAGKGGPEGDDLMMMLDQDGDGAVNLKEYITLIESLACMCNCVLEGKMCLHFI